MARRPIPKGTGRHFYDEFSICPALFEGVETCLEAAWHHPIGAA